MSGRAETLYAYVNTTDGHGTMAGKITRGLVTLEREYKGNGEYTWQVFDVRRGEIVGWWTGRYIGKVERDEDGLTDESVAFLHEHVALDTAGAERP